MNYSFPLTPPPPIPVTLETIAIGCYIASGGLTGIVPAPTLVGRIKTCLANGPANFTEVSTRSPFLLV